MIKGRSRTHAVGHVKEPNLCILAREARVHNNQVSRGSLSRGSDPGTPRLQDALNLCPVGLLAMFELPQNMHLAPQDLDGFLSLERRKTDIRSGPKCNACSSECTDWCWLCTRREVHGKLSGGRDLQLSGSALSTFKAWNAP